MSVYFKVFKYNFVFFGRIKIGVLGVMRVFEFIIVFNEWFEVFSKMNDKVEMRIEDFENLFFKLREVYNVEY